VGQDGLSKLQRIHVEEFLSDFSKHCMDVTDGTPDEDKALDAITLLEQQKEGEALPETELYQAYRMVKYGASDLLLANTADQFITKDEKRILQREYSRGEVTYFFSSINMWADYLKPAESGRWYCTRERLVENGMLDPERVTLVTYYMNHRKHKR